VTDGTNTVDSPVSITIITTPDTTLLALAQALAARAQADIESAQALADMLDDTQQMNANVIKEVRRLIADLQTSGDYMAGIVEQLEDVEEPT
jgi:signal transduction histidine kinase